MKIKYYIFALAMTAMLAACGGEQIPLPAPPEDITDAIEVVSDTTYLQLRPVWDASNGYDFNRPMDVLLGREPLIYVADTDNNRIAMLDLAGTVLGYSQPIETPVGLTQDSKLNLLAVTSSNKIYRLNLVAAHHQIDQAPVELVFEEVDNPDRRYTGIAAVLKNIRGRAGIAYYVSATGNDKRDNQVLIFPEDFKVIGNPSPVNLEPNGLGILAASIPSGITALRDFSDDFIFCMIGQNSFKVQWITPGEFGFTARFNPDQDLFEPGKFSQPEDVTVDPQGNIYVVDAHLNHLFKFSSAGDEQQSFGDTGSGEKQFREPSGVAFFDKTLYVADTGNNRIMRFKLSTDVE